MAYRKGKTGRITTRTKSSGTKAGNKGLTTKLKNRRAGYIGKDDTKRLRFGGVKLTARERRKTGLGR